MPNIKSQIKRTKTNEVRRVRNVSFKSSLKTAVKNVETAVKDNNKTEAITALNFANKKFDQALSRGIFHKNTVARNKSRLAKLVNSL